VELNSSSEQPSRLPPAPSAREAAPAHPSLTRPAFTRPAFTRPAVTRPEHAACSQEDTRIRPAECSDADAIADLFRGGFRPEIVQLFIYGCPGAAEFIRLQIAQEDVSSAVYFVADTPQGVVAAAEWRRAPARLFLNYIAVHPHHQGSGVGALLWGESIRRSGVNSGAIALDVLDDNTRARSWYQRLGLRDRQASDFLEIETVATPLAREAYVSGWPQADLCHRHFGFSQFTLTSAQRSCSVGRIGTGWYRLDDPSALDDASILGTMRRLDPCRRVFAVVPRLSAQAPVPARILATTLRMEADIGHVLGGLYCAEGLSGEL
jgi:ribosomal protein S18 acetylase RimI-like enzyme